MTGARIPGPYPYERDAPEACNPPLAGFKDAAPLGAGSKGGAGKGGAGPTLRGWPRAIAWTEFRDLAERPEGEHENAQIKAEGIQPPRAEVAREDGRLRLAAYEVRVVVNRELSWVVTGTKTDVLLDHEQGHFDIQGLTTRDMVAALAALRADNADDLQNEVSRIIAQAQTDGQAMSDLYDSEAETDHGRDQVRQARWNEAIRAARDGGTALVPPSH